MEVVIYSFQQHGDEREQLVVLDYYREEDYIRDYQKFIEHLKEN